MLAFLCVVHVDGVDVDVVNVDGDDVGVDAPVCMLMSCACLSSPCASLEIWMSYTRFLRGMHVNCLPLISYVPV